ncbi:pro-sigmaK processing inhibitor BofA family protein [Clostridium isatidis]|uniref:Pro-sigmaK processing inhibitor BofA n=1 Tax=Clostridium isatidis TaxID=182773 RepID=A0A343JFM1_9CLOT|nr:pro-sigmaK processing inhibitor BofA family protein [Clostridium isatidis]ASW44329.1 pro-sigmaK processing inhibitor BofA [Clostridium isatidis]NLZ34155.1 pro-sigmaK processing inhibitor BofA [Clostridiales bacterium]
MDTLFFGLIGLVLLIIVLKILKWPFKILINGIIGLVLLYLANILGSYLGFTIAINAVTALIAGFLGIPGIILLVIFQLFF